MHLRDMVIGAVSTLVVTVLSGVAVFYATKEPDQNKTERLVYSINETAMFSGGAQDLAFSSVRLENTGGVAAKGVSIRIAFPSAELKDLSVKASAGLREAKRGRTDKELIVIYETLLPTEAVNFSLLLTKAERPTVEIRSDASIASELVSAKEEPETRRSKINLLIGKTIPTIAIMTISLIPMWFWLFKRRRYLFADRNNSGFLLLHNGLVDEASAILSAALMHGHYEPEILSNYALAKALRGDSEHANGLIQAARFLSGSKHAQAIVLFNEGLIQLISGDKQVALDTLKAAISMWAEIRVYCRQSVHLDKVRTEPAFYDLLKVP